MKFIYSDSLDFVDPDYDFADDSNAAKRRVHEHDEYPHEHMDRPPYDGILISRAIVGGPARVGKYTPAQAMRLSRDGARAFLRYPASRFPKSTVMGDCGAFSYRNAKLPPYTVDDTLEFYEDGGFTHGCSVDHLIFDFTDSVRAPSAEVRDRYDLTLEYARAFLAGARSLKRFTPLGVVQGWSPVSMARAGRELAGMGYDYLAVGGMVPLRTPQIEQALEAIRAELPSRTKLHVLGFGKIDDVEMLARYGVASFDTTSPLTRAFKDAKKNYYELLPGGGLDYYTAVRVPQATTNDRMLRNARKGDVNQERLTDLESEALCAIRSFGLRASSADSVVDRVMEYNRYAQWGRKRDSGMGDDTSGALRASYLRTLNARAWERCTCRVCREIGIEAIIFRSSNRNKRRGMHNLQVFNDSLRARFGRGQ